MEFDHLGVTQSLEQPYLPLDIPLLLGVLQFILLVDFDSVTTLLRFTNALLDHRIAALAYDIAYSILVSQVGRGAPLLLVPGLEEVFVGGVGGLGSGEEVLFALDALVGEVVVLAGDDVDLLFDLSPLLPAFGHHVQSGLVILVELVDDLESSDGVVLQLGLGGGH